MKKRRTLFALGGGFLLITALWFAAAFVLRLFIPTLESRGVFGDSYGALNALFSGLAFAGVVFALLQQNESRDQQAEGLRLQLEALKIQQQDLALQLAEMKATREEMSRATKAQEEAARAMAEQRHATLLNAAITAQTAFMHNILERAKLNNWGFQSGDDSWSAQADANKRVGALLALVHGQLGLDRDGKPVPTEG